MKYKKKVLKIIKTLAVIVLMVLQHGDVPRMDSQKAPEYGPLRPGGGLICQPVLLPLSGKPE